MNFFFIFDVYIYKVCVFVTDLCLVKKMSNRCTWQDYGRLGPHYGTVGRALGIVDLFAIPNSGFLLFNRRGLVGEEVVAVVQNPVSSRVTIFHHSFVVMIDGASLRGEWLLELLSTGAFVYQL